MGHGHEQILIFALIALIVYHLWQNRKGSTSLERFEVPPVMSLPPLPEFVNATPMTLIHLYGGQTEKLAGDLKGLDLPEPFLADPKNYPVIISALKRLNMLPGAS